MAGILNKARLSELFYEIVGQVRKTGRAGSNVIALFRDRVRHTLPGDLDRIKQKEYQMAQNMFTHPPDSFRLEALYSHRVESAHIVLSVEQADRLQAELAPFYPTIEQRILDQS